MTESIFAWAMVPIIIDSIIIVVSMFRDEDRANIVFCIWAIITGLFALSILIGMIVKHVRWM